MFEGIAAMAAIIEANKKREEWIATLSPEEQQKIRVKDEKDAKENLAHKRALEIAEASRPRNFWGK